MLRHMVDDALICTRFDPSEIYGVCISNLASIITAPLEFQTNVRLSLAACISADSPSHSIGRFQCLQLAALKQVRDEVRGFAPRMSEAALYCDSQTGVTVLLHRFAVIVNDRPVAFLCRMPSSHGLHY